MDCPETSVCAEHAQLALEDTDMDPKDQKWTRTKKLISPVTRFFYYYRSLEVNVYAAYAAYFILLSVFPAIISVLLRYRLLFSGRISRSAAISWKLISSFPASR